MLGWEPAEFHEHEYDEAGHLVRTVVTRESEFNDADTHALLGLQRYELEVGQCGHHKSMTAPDSGNFFEPTVETCNVCAGLAQFQRRQHAQDEEVRDRIRKDSKGRPDPLAKDPADGRTTYMRLLTAEEVAERQAAQATSHSV